MGIWKLKPISYTVDFVDEDNVKYATMDCSFDDHFNWSGTIWATNDGISAIGSVISRLEPIIGPIDAEDEATLLSQPIAYIKGSNDNISVEFTQSIKSAAGQLLLETLKKELLTNKELGG